MLNSVNGNEDVNNSQVSGQLGVSSIATNPINSPYRNNDKNLLIDETAISNEAINLYQKDQDIKQFTTLATSDPEDLSHEDIIAGLFKSGASDLFSDETISELSSNENLINDLSDL